jgi:hypothetical protein
MLVCTYISTTQCHTAALQQHHTAPHSSTPTAPRSASQRRCNSTTQQHTWEDGGCPSATYQPRVQDTQ